MGIVINVSQTKERRPRGLSGSQNRGEGSKSGKRDSTWNLFQYDSGADAARKQLESVNRVAHELQALRSPTSDSTTWRRFDSTNHDNTAATDHSWPSPSKAMDHDKLLPIDASPPSRKTSRFFTNSTARESPVIVESKRFQRDLGITSPSNPLYAFDPLPTQNLDSFLPSNVHTAESSTSESKLIPSLSLSPSPPNLASGFAAWSASVDQVHPVVDGVASHMPGNYTTGIEPKVIPEKKNNNRIDMVMEKIKALRVNMHRSPTRADGMETKSQETNEATEALAIPHVKLPTHAIVLPPPDRQLNSETLPAHILESRNMTILVHIPKGNTSRKAPIADIKRFLQQYDNIQSRRSSINELPRTENIILSLPGNHLHRQFDYEINDDAAKIPSYHPFDDVLFNTREATVLSSSSNGNYSRLSAHRGHGSRHVRSTVRTSSRVSS